jgi:hypothetical protein
VIHAFNERGFDALDPKPSGGRRKQIGEQLGSWICTIARTSPADWGITGPTARANLRTAVWALRQALGADALVTTRSSVALGPLVRDIDDPSDLDDELCAGLDEDWVEAARAEHRRHRIARLDTLIAETRDPASAARTAARRCGLTPLDESAHQAVDRGSRPQGGRLALREPAGPYRADQPRGLELGGDLGIEVGYQLHRPDQQRFRRFRVAGARSFQACPSSTRARSSAGASGARRSPARRYAASEAVGLHATVLNHSPRRHQAADWSAGLNRASAPSHARSKSAFRPDQA